MNSKLDNFKWHCETKLYKYANDENYKQNKPNEILNIDGNMALTKGIKTLWQLANGQMDNENVYGYTTENSYLGVGTSTVAEDPAQTSLIAATPGSSGQVAYAPMDTSQSETYPIIENNKITFRAEFGASVGNFAWNEFGILNGDPSNAGVRPPETIVLLNRKVSALGTKVEGSTWVLIMSITIS